MFDTIKSKLNSSTEAEKISPAEVAKDVASLHETLDEFKVWSTETVEWLEIEQERLEQKGEQEYVNELDDLIAYVQSIFLRIEYGDYAISAATEEAENAAEDGE